MALSIMTMQFSNWWEIYIAIEKEWYGNQYNFNASVEYDVKSCIEDWIVRTDVRWFTALFSSVNPAR